MSIIICYSYNRATPLNYDAYCSDAWNYRETVLWKRVVFCGKVTLFILNWFGIYSMLTIAKRATCAAWVTTPKLYILYASGTESRSILCADYIYNLCFVKSSLSLCFPCTRTSANSARWIEYEPSEVWFQLYNSS